MKTLPLTALILLITISVSANADCVYGAKGKTKFTVLDNHTIILQGGYSHDIIIKTYCFLNRSSSVTVLKDDFCSYDNAVLYIDGEVCEANQVTKVN